MSSSQFSEWVQTSPQEHCVIEIKKKGCLACVTNGRLFDHFSTQVDLPLFRMQSGVNVSPYLGQFTYTPVYLLVRKQGSTVVEIKTLTTPSENPDSFVKEVARGTKKKEIVGKVKI